MKTFLASILLLLGIGLVSAAHAEADLEPPPPGKAVVYIGRLNAFVGGGRPFHFFEGENYLVRIKGRNYIRYVCDPGEKIFWASAENRSFVTASLEAGRSYALHAKLQTGTWSARVELIPITNGSAAWKDFAEMLDDKKAEKIDAKYAEKWRAGHPEYVAEALAEWRAAGAPALTLMPDEFVE